MDNNKTDSYGNKGLCPDPLVDLQISWNTQDPDVSICLQKTILVLIPCGLLWLLAPVQAWRLYKKKVTPVPHSILNILRTVLTAGLALLAAGDIGYWATRESSSVDILDPVVRGITWILVILVIQGERLKGCRSSGVLWVFWSLALLSSIPRLYSQIRRELLDPGLHRTEFISNTLGFVLIVVEWILGFFLDTLPAYQEAGSGDETRNPSPETTATFPSRLLFNWFNVLAWTGYKRSIVEEDLWDLNPRDRSSTVVPKFNRYWDAKLRLARLEKRDQPDASYGVGSDTVKIEPGTTQKARDKLSVFGPLVKSFGGSFLVGSVLKLFHDLLVFMSPLLLRRIISFSETDEPIWHGVMYALGLLLFAQIQTLMLSQYFFRMYMVGMWSKSSIISAIYRKSLHVSSSAKKDTTSGEIVNLMSVDCQRIADIVPYLNMLWSSPLQISVAIYMLYQILGPSVFAGLAVMIVLIPVNGVIAGVTRKLHMRMMKQKDVRVKKMNELLQGMKILKLYAWEQSFLDEVEVIRNKELSIMMKMAYLSAGTSFVWSCAPFVVSLVSFMTFVLSDDNNVLDSQKAFTSLALFNILRFPLSMLPMMITSAIQANVSIKRINKFMRSHELDSENISRKEMKKGKDAVNMTDAAFQWEEATPKEEGKTNGEVKTNGVAKDNGDVTAVNDSEDTKMLNGNAAASKDEGGFKLNDINVSIKAGSLCAVVGSVGSGKSSFLSALLGEMDKTSGDVEVFGSIAAVSQQAWIQNATVEQNITFGSKVNREKYDRVISDCALKSDLEILPAGDKTEIGEKGINLSGGQKQRVAVARAVYRDADLYLFDDPLSAVDSHVGKHIFDKVIGPSGCLADKTRILVTHAVTFLPQVDQIIVFKDGKISESGTYKELLTQKGDFAEFLVQYLSESDEDPDTQQIKIELQMQLGKEEFVRKLARARTESENRDPNQRRGSDQSNTSAASHMSMSPSKSMSPVKSPEKPKEDKKHVQYQDEKSETGRVSWRIYLIYFKNMGYCLFFTCFFLYATYQFFTAFSSIWLSLWADRSLPFLSNTTMDELRADNRTLTNIYLGVYGGLGFSQALGAIFASLLLYLSTLSGAKALHQKMLVRIMHSPMSFFDTTPQGRIINRFSKDVDVLDSTMPMILRGWITCLLQVIATFLVIMYTTPPAIIFIFFVLVGYMFVQRVYVASSRQLKRLESVSKSPIYSHFGETISGASMIRAYGLRDHFVRESQMRVDKNHRAAFAAVISNRWLAVRLETVGNCIIFGSALFAVIARDQLTGGLVGLSVSFALQVTQTLNWLVRMASELETNIVAVERLDEYSQLSVEDDWEREQTAPATSWPAEGKITLEKYSTRYREGLDLVLKDISVEFNGGERVGIVGRTGAGKSSLTLALFRIIEPSGGSIKIDGVDVSKLGLHRLRSRLTIIPQDPVLFSGTLRHNLDPFKQYEDSAVWEALRHSHLYEFVNGLSAGLEHEVSESGENLSVGQRQLVCLARALLRKTKILVLDEATAAIDLETDDLIQKTIRTEFDGCTIITIAHRLNTILDYDRVLVLSEGRVAELDSPKVLMNKNGSIFRGMCQDAGLA